MVTQREAVTGYIKMQANFETFNKLIEYRFEELKTYLQDANNTIEQHLLQCEACKQDHGNRIRELEEFKSKVIYFYTAISTVIGILIGWRLL
jgi:hypothetical protein